MTSVSSSTPSRSTSWASGGLLDGEPGFLEVGRGEVVAEVVGEPLVRADEHLRDAVVGLEFAEDVVDDRGLTDREEHLRPVLGDGPQPGRIAPSEDDSLHTLEVIASR